MNACTNDKDLLFNFYAGMSSFDVGRYTGTWYEYSNVFEVFQVGNLLIHVS